MDDAALTEHADRVVTHVLDVFTIHFADRTRTPSAAEC